RGGFATLYSHGGGTGGAGGAGTGPSQLGFTSAVSFPANAAGPAAGPTFYLNNGASFQTQGIGNANFGGPGYSVPPIQAPGAVSQTLNVGNTVDQDGNFIKAGAAPTYADFYVAGRAPEFNFWNFGIDRELSNNITISIDYAGSESHFIYGAGNIRGLYAGQVNPVYYALGSLLNAPANAANLAAAQAIIPSITVPYAGFEQAATTKAGSGQATIGRMLTWKPQFSGTSDGWGASTANASYHALQISAHKRISNGLDITANYTYSKQIDDAGTQRDGYAIPAGLTLDGKAWRQNRIDRGISATSVPQNLAVFGTYRMPFGQGSLGGSVNPVARQVIKGWNLGGTFTYSSGTPLLVTSSNCVSPFAGTCMPDVNSNFTGKTIRENGSWGKGITAANFSAIHYLVNPKDGSCSTGTCPFSDPQPYMFGDAPRTMAYDGLRNPGHYSLNGSVSRTFDISERWKFVFRADCQNITNKVTFGSIQASMDNTNFGTVGSATGNTGSRDFQFSGRINF
ncbi:MAG TPA: carboxypeptidase regulatory-like domain-containing protein, partial [Terracidiphilus sp.]